MSLTQPRGTRLGMRWDLLTSWLMGLEACWRGEVPLGGEATLTVSIRVVDCGRLTMETCGRGELASSLASDGTFVSALEDAEGSERGVGE